MGGRGASSGTSIKGEKYGTEYHAVKRNGSALVIGNVKFIKQNKKGSSTAPMETMTKGRVYAFIDSGNRLNSIIYFNENLKRKKSINLLHGHKNIKGAHTHEGYLHDENGTHRLTAKERRMVARVTKIWYNLNSK
nr:MAG TPA: hypothetical protein [Bacteriophage sp.]